MRSWLLSISSYFAKLSSWLTLRRKALLSAAIGIGTFLLLFIFVSYSKGDVGDQPAGAGAMLVIITATAVGIERILEIFWSLVGQLANGWWPFNKMFVEVTALEQDVKAQLDAAQDALKTALNNAGGVINGTTTRLIQAQAEMKKLQDRLSELQKLAPGNQRVTLIAAAVNQGLGMIAQHQPKIDYNLRLIDQSIAGLTDFVASCKENPVRRIINIWAGAMIGLVVAYLMRLDVFFAVLGKAETPVSWPYLGVALTGLIIGLGSNPTHDVIAALQETKKYRASLNQPSPITNETALVESGGLPSGSAVNQFQADFGTLALPPVRRFR